MREDLLSGPGHSAAAIPFLMESLEPRRLLSVVPLTSAVPAGNSTPFGYSPAQIDKAYGIDSIHFGSVVGNGAGQTIAVVDAFNDPVLLDSTDPNFSTSDLHLFDQTFGLPDPPSFLKVDQNGGTNYPANDSIWANEEAMDVEWAHALAPAANILLVEADNSNLTNLISAAVDYARNVSGVSVISMSFATPEQSFETSFDSVLTTPSNHAGVTFVAASGDSGTPGGYPATSPNVLAVGATTLTLSNSGGYGSETGYADSGGGASLYENKPAYQNALFPSSVSRTTPDVSFNGDLNTGVDVYDSFNGGSSAPWYKVGGTSSSAPAWSALIAIANQGRALRGLPSLDGPSQTLPLLYQLNNFDFNDITTGNNGFAAGPGYDLVTGRGTPKANLLVPDLAGYASISGTVQSSAPLPNVTVYIDANNNGVVDTGEFTAVTDSAGNYELAGLLAGTYTVRQVLPAGQKQILPTDGFGNHVTVADTQAFTNANFTDQQLPTAASITGTVFTDTNGNGKQDPGETGIAKITIYNDANNNGKLDPGEISTMTTADGSYALSNLTAGAYLLRQILPSGAKQTFPSSNFGNHVTLDSGQTVANINFGEQNAVVVTAGGSITGAVSNSANGTGIANVTVYNDINNNGKLDPGEISTITAANGTYFFTNLSAGAYLIRQILPGGDKQISPSNNFGNHVALAANQSVNGINFSDQTTAVTFASISGTVFNSATNTGISAVVLYIDLTNSGIFKSGDPEVTANASGVYTFSNLAAGTYIVRQMVPKGFTQITPANNFGTHVTVVAGQASIGNNFNDKA